MIIKQLISLSLFGLLIGCGGPSPEAKNNLNSFRIEMSSYVELMASNPKPTELINQFDVLNKHWEKLKTDHHLPRSLDKRISNGFNVYNFVLVNFEYFLDSNPEIERTAKEEKELHDHWENEIAKAYSKIDSRYWDVLEKKLKSDGGTPEELELLESLKHDPMLHRGYIDLTACVGISKHALELNFKAFADTLDK